MTNEPASNAPSRTTRRALLRTGAHAAWAVPAIQVASMVPAFATSGSPTLTVVAAKTNGSGSARTVTYTANVTGTSGSVTGIQFKIANNTPGSLDQTPLTDGILGVILATGATCTGANWAITPASGNGPYTLTYSGPKIDVGHSVAVVVNFSRTYIGLGSGSDKRIKADVTASASSSGTLTIATPQVLTNLA